MLLLLPMLQIAEGSKPRERPGKLADVDGKRGSEFDDLFARWACAAILCCAVGEEVLRPLHSVLHHLQLDPDVH
jgi:hypothetical protein